MSADLVDELIRDGDKYRTGEISLDFFARLVPIYSSPDHPGDVLVASCMRACMRARLIWGCV